MLVMLLKFSDKGTTVFIRWPKSSIVVNRPEEEKEVQDPVGSCGIKKKWIKLKNNVAVSKATYQQMESIVICVMPVCLFFHKEQKLYLRNTVIKGLFYSCIVCFVWFLLMQRCKARGKECCKCSKMEF